MATTFDLGVIFRAIDKLSVPMQQMQKKLDIFSEKAKKVSESLTRVGEKLSLYVTAPIIGLGVAMIKTSSDLVESLNKVEVAFGDNANTIKDWSLTTLKNFGIAQGTSLDMAATFGDMATSMGLATDQAADMSKELVGRIGDLSSFKNISNDIAQTALVSIFSGETESLKRLGVVMTEVNLQEYAYRNGINKKIKDMTQVEKVMLRYNYVMEMTNNSAGDFVRTGGGAANQMRIFTESLKELASNFGQIILPIFTKVITRLNKIVQWFGHLNNRTKKVILTILAVAAAIGPLVFIIGKLITVVSMVGKAFQVLRMIMTPQGLIILGIIAAIIALIIIIRNWGKITAWLKDKWSKLFDFIQRMPRIIFILIKVFQPLLFLPLMIIRNWQTIKTFFANLLSGIWNLFDNWIVQLVGSILMPFIGLPITIIKNWQGIASFFSNLWQGIVNAFSTAIEFIKNIWDAFMGWAMKNPVLKWLFETKPKKTTIDTKEKEANKQLEAQKKQDQEQNKKSLMNMDSMFKNFKKTEAEKSIVYVNVKVMPEDGALAKVNDIKSTGNVKKRVTTDNNNLGWSYQP